MPDTGAPWNIPYVEASDLVRDYPAASLALGTAIAAGLTAAGGLVEVKTVLKTDTFSASVAAGANAAVTDLSITHTLANAANKLILMAFFGAAASSATVDEAGIAIADGGTLIGVGATAGSRTSVGAGGQVSTADSNLTVTMPHVHVVYTPGDTAAHTYTVNVVNISASSRTLYVNRSQSDADAATSPRAASVLTLMEVKV